MRFEDNIVMLMRAVLPDERVAPVKMVAPERCYITIMKGVPRNSFNTTIWAWELQVDVLRPVPVHALFLSLLRRERSLLRQLYQSRLAQGLMNGDWRPYANTTWYG